MAAWVYFYFPAFGWGLSLRTHTFNKSGAYYEMFSPGGGAFIEAIKPLSRWAMFRHFSAFGRGLSLRHARAGGLRHPRVDFPAFGWGLSLRLGSDRRARSYGPDFSAFGWGLSSRRATV